MTQSDIGIVERLNGRVKIEMACGNRTENPNNHVRLMDEAAAIIMEMVEALEDARNQLQHVNKCHVHLDSTDSLLGEIDTTLAKVRSK